MMNRPPSGHDGWLKIGSSGSAVLWKPNGFAAVFKIRYVTDFLTLRTNDVTDSYTLILGRAQTLRCRVRTDPRMAPSDD